MAKRLGAAFAMLLAAVVLIAPQGAAAATEVGNNCTANDAAPNLTLLQISKGSSSPPITTPTAGVVTQWKVNVIPFEGAIAEQLRVFRGSGTSFQTVGESSTESVVGGSNTFSTRIPVQAGDRFGVYASGGFGTLFCQTENPADVMGFFEGNAGVGSTQSYSEAAGLQVAMLAIVEPDVDADGFGDETQDKCPQSAAVQSECPLILLSSFGLARKGSALALVAASSPAPVTVTGRVAIPRKARKRARASAIVRLSGGTQAVAPGQIGQFTLKFPRRLKSALAALPRKRSLTLTIVTAAIDVAGRPSSSTVKLKLRGQAKAKPRGKAKR